MADTIYTTSDVVLYDTTATVESSRPLPQTPACAATGVTQPSSSSATGVTQPSDNVYAQIATSSGTSTARDGFTKNTQILAFASVVMGVLIALGISAYSLHSLKTAETEIIVLRGALARSEAETTSLISETARLKAARETSDAKIAKLTEANQTVMFTAKNTATREITANIAIIFPDVQLNLGGGYNRSSGIFTAPHSGSYFLTTNVCSWPRKQVAVSLVAADTAIATTVKYNDANYVTCTTISGVAVLREGDTASVQGAYSQTEAMYSGSPIRWPSFAGMLVHKT